MRLDWYVNMGQQTQKNKTFLQSFRHAFDGVLYSVRQERNMRKHFVMCSLVIILGWVCQVSVLEWLWLAQCMAFILFAELINSVVEIVVDAVTQHQYFEWAKHAKDMTAGAVLICACYTVCVGTIIFVPKLLSWIN